MYQVATKCRILDDEIKNVSDHLPNALETYVFYNTMGGKKETYNNREQVAWHKMTTEEIDQKYTSPLENCMHALIQKHEMGRSDGNGDILSDENLNTLIKEFILCIKSVSSDLPQTKYSKTL